MGDYANDYIDNCVTEYFESNSNCFDDGIASLSPTISVKRDNTEDYSKCAEKQLRELKNDIDGVMLRNSSINSVVIVLKETEKAFLFSSEDMDVHFWCPKSILYKSKKELEKYPNNQVFYLPNWFKLTNVKNVK